MTSNTFSIGFVIGCGRAGEKTACEGVRRSGELAGVEWESESLSSSLQCDDSEESEKSEVAGDEGGETGTALVGTAGECWAGRRSRSEL